MAYLQERERTGVAHPKAWGLNAGCVSVILLLLWLIPLGLSSRTVRVGISQNAPKLFVDEDGLPSGIYVDILQEIAQQEDWRLEYYPGEWAELMNRLSEGDIDLLPDMAYTSERAEQFSFHETPVLFSWSQIYARKGLALQSITDLDGYRVAVLQNSVQAKALHEMIQGFGMNTELLYAVSFDEAMAAVKDGKADVAATNSFYGRINARRFGLEDSPVVFEPSTLFFVSAKDRNLDLLQVIDQHLVRLKNTPHSVYYKSLKQWYLTNEQRYVPIWLWYGLAILAALLITIMISWFVLKQRVKERTKELKQAYLEMEKRVDERTEELGLALQQAKVADMLKSAFLATMSHELRTPLNSIIGFTGILLQELPGAINDEQRKQLSIVQSSSRHLLSLINDVLDISKIEAGQLELKYSEILPQKSLAKLQDLMSTQIDNKGLVLEMNCDHNSGTIITDERRFEQIMLNLLSNAVKFTEKGKISVECERGVGTFRFHVKDTGIGIPEDQFDKLFLPFRQIDSGLTRKYEGSGLGLSISKKLAQLMGGDLFVSSKLGEGSVFSLELPLRPREEP